MTKVKKKKPAPLTIKVYDEDGNIMFEGTPNQCDIFRQLHELKENEKRARLAKEARQKMAPLIRPCLKIHVPPMTKFHIAGMGSPTYFDVRGSK